jgi:hypothetical protein
MSADATQVLAAKRVTSATVRLRRLPGAWRLAAKHVHTLRNRLEM